MISKHDIETPRSPRGLRQFVTRRIKKIRGIREARHKAILKKGIYKVFSDEIIPLSIFCLKNYPNTYWVKPVIGNQGYDAIIEDNKGRVIEYVELTIPHDGATDADDSRLVVKRTYGKTDVYKPGENLTRMFSTIIKTCNKKSLKDYSDCSLVVIVNFITVSNQEKLYLTHIDDLINKIKTIPFKANKVYLLVMPYRKLFSVSE